MWKNIRIRRKLLLGYGFLLFIFSIAIAYSWVKIEAVRRESQFLAQGSVPSMLLGGDIERNAYELFYAMRGFRYREDQENLKTVQAYVAKISEELETAKSRYAADSRLLGLKPIVEDVVPAFEAYARNIEAAVPVTVKKKESFDRLVADSREMGELADRMAESMYKALQAEASGLGVGELLRKVEMIRTCENLRSRISFMRMTILRSLLTDDVEGVRSTTEMAGEVNAEAGRLHAVIGRQDLKSLMVDLLKRTESYKAALGNFVNLQIQVQTLTEQRRPLMDEMDEHSTEGSVWTQNRVKEIAEKSVHNLNASVYVLLVSAALSVVLGFGIALFIARGISGPLNTIVKLAARAGDGDLTIEREDFEYEGKDELGTLVAALSSMVAAQEDALNQVIGVARKVAEGAENLSAISEETNAAMEEVKASVDQVASLSRNNGTALEGCNAGIEEVSAGADAAAQSATDSAAFIVGTVQSANNAIETVNEVIRKMRSVSENAQRNEEKMRQLIAAVEKIGSFVSVITGIADQTNLLALNAAIEAARAGEAGRGFAVVSEEVRKLAEESSRSAQNVDEIIGQLQTSAGESIAATTEAGKLLMETLTLADHAQAELGNVLSEMNKANDSVQNIAAVAQEQAASSKEVATAIDNTTRTTREVVDTIDGIRHASEETAYAAQNVAEQSQAMSEYSLNLKNILSRFRVREALEKDDALRLKALNSGAGAD